MGEAEAEARVLSKCIERDRLLYDYQAAMVALSRVIQMLAERSGTMRKAEYEEAWQYAEAARLKSESARRELDLHTDEHGC